MNAIFYAISQNEFRWICPLTLTKEAWDLLEVTHEGTCVVKKSKLQILTTKFEELKMEEDKQSINFYSKLQDLVNSRAGLGNPLKPNVIKSLNHLERFRPKVTTIEESKDIDTLIIELVGSLQSFEMTFKPNIKNKRVTLKVEELSSSKEISMMRWPSSQKGLGNFIKRMQKNFRRNFFSRNPKDSSRRKEISTDEVVCYECKKSGHFPFKCANKKSKSKGKRKKAITTTWDDNIDDSDEISSSSDDDS